MDVGSTFWFIVDITEEFVPNLDAKQSSVYVQMSKDIQRKDREILKSSRTMPKKKYHVSKNSSVKVFAYLFKLKIFDLLC